MSNKDMKKLIAFLLIMMGGLLFISCNRHMPTEESFSFEVSNPKTTVSVGETVTYTAKLKNLTDEKYVLKHGIPLISLYIYPDGEQPQDIIGATLVTTLISGGETIEKTITVQIEEAGDYILRAFCSFNIGEKEFLIEEERITITTVDAVE